MDQTFRRSPLTLVRCLSIGICTLLISPALAQVNGPGPSPSSDFDIVLNLPGDEAVITGGYNESIGGVAGQTTQLNVSDGGNVGFSFEANSGSEVNISGGTVGDFFDANSGSEVNILGSAFSINGEPLNMLQAGQPFTITGRDVTLSGVLADGEPFSFDLNSTPYSDQDFFSPDATLTVTLFLLADVNLDGSVNFFDISPFIELLLSNQFQNEADIDRNGVVNFFDISPFIEILSGA